MHEGKEKARSDNSVCGIKRLKLAKELLVLTLERASWMLQKHQVSHQTQRIAHAMSNLTENGLPIVCF